MAGNVIISYTRIDTRTGRVRVTTVSGFDAKDATEKLSAKLELEYEETEE